MSAPLSIALVMRPDKWGAAAHAVSGVRSNEALGGKSRRMRFHRCSLPNIGAAVEEQMFVAMTKLGDDVRINVVMRQSSLRFVIYHIFRCCTIGRLA
jgi:hypothetical protein